MVLDVPRTSWNSHFLPDPETRKGPTPPDRRGRAFRFYLATVRTARVRPVRLRRPEHSPRRTPLRARRPEPPSVPAACVPWLPLPWRLPAGLVSRRT
jgi:hypothetical protein